MEETKSLIKDENYVLIQGWMRNQLGLKNNDLTIYAIIYGFSQTSNNGYNGSLQYLADWCGCTKQGTLKCLKSLIAKNYIIKEETFNNNVKFCSYKANLEVVTQFTSVKQSLTGGIKQSLTGIKQSLTGGIKLSLTNNIDINNKDNNKDIDNIDSKYTSEEELNHRLGFATIKDINPNIRY